MTDKYFLGVNEFNKLISNKNVAFLSTKQMSYIRNAQWTKCLKKNANKVWMGGSENKKYIYRVIKVYLQGIKWLFVKDVKVLFAGFAPQLMLPLLFLYKITGRTVIIDFFISMYDTFVCDRKKVRENSMVAKLFHLLDHLTLKQADIIIADTEAHRDYFISEFEAVESKCLVVYLQADETIYWPRKQNKSSELCGKYIVLYFGSVLPLQGIEVVLQAMFQLRDQADIQFIFVGNVEKIGNIDKNIYKNVIFYNWLSQEKLAEEIGMADLCLAGHFNASIEKAKRTIAGKTYIYRMMQKPIILGDNPANRELFDDEPGSVYFVPMGDPVALANTILNAKKDWVEKKYVQ